ncbi:MAG: TIGR01777 family oxidoreductase [Thermoactinomyces sp.]|jgi:uncharacterized protein (TIGR01777 family)
MEAGHSKKVVLAGGSGFLGQSLANALLERGYEVVILTRSPSAVREGIQYVQWDGETLGNWVKEIETCAALINFTGKSVNCIYTKKNREEIISSRVNSVRVLHQAIANCANPPEVFIQAGSLAIYGNTTRECDENASYGNGFSVDVCKQWEEEFFKRPLPHTRQVLFRIGFALGKNGGALEPLEKLVKFHLGGTIGSGKQYISWIHIEDLNQMFLTAIENSKIIGIYNATGPNPTTNKVFMKTLRNVLEKSWAPPAPAPLVWLGAYLIMRAAPELALTGRNCIPKRMIEHGFSFTYSNLEEALNEIYS